METKSQELLAVEQAIEKKWLSISRPNGYEVPNTLVNLELRDKSKKQYYRIEQFKEDVGPLITRAAESMQEAIAAIDSVFAQMTSREDEQGTHDPHRCDCFTYVTIYDARPAITLAGDPVKLRKAITQKFRKSRKAVICP